MTTIPPAVVTTTTTTTTEQPASNSFKAIVRSLTPFVYSTVASIIARLGYHVTMKTTVEIVAIVGAALTIALHALETQFPWVGVLLGYIGAPVYVPVQTKASLQAQISSIESQFAAYVAQHEGATPVVVPVVSADTTTSVAPPTPYNVA